MSAPESLLRDVLTKISEEVKYDKNHIKIEPISSGGANYTSTLYEASLTKDGKDDIHLFAKVAAIGEDLRKTDFDDIFSKEMFFYKELLQYYRDIEEKHNVPKEKRLLVPTMYGYSDKYSEEILVLDNLVKKGYKQFDRFKSIDKEYTFKCFEQLAKLHALSFVLSVENSNKYERTKKSLNNIPEGFLNNFLLHILPSAIEGIREENKERVRRLADNLRRPENMSKILKPTSKPVIIHGDFRPSNLMHRINNGVLEVITVDFQTIRHSTPLYDVLYFLYTGSDKEFRKLHYKECLEYYYSELADNIRRLGVDPDKVYSKEDFYDEYKEMLPLVIVIFFCSLLVVTVDTDAAPAVGEDMKMENFALKPNETFIQRVNDIVDDLIDMNVI